MLNALLLSVLPFVFGVSGDRREPDLVVLKAGEEVECRVLYEDDAEVVYSVKRKEKRVPRAEVESVQSVERSLRDFLARFEKASPTDVAAMSELALFCEQSFLAGEARNLWIRVIALDPENEQAWTKLGGSKGRKGWRLQVNGRFYDLAELKERASDWKNALELSTAHFLLKTDGDPVRALDASIDIERAYQAFYDVIGKPLKLYVFDEEPEIHIFSDPKDYPSAPGQGQMVWFDRSANTLNVSATSQTWLGDVVSELTQCLIFNAFRRSADSKTGEIEPWAQHGLMSAFAAAVRPDPGRVAFEFEPPYRPWFEKQARDAKPLDLERILTSGRGSYEGGPDAERYAIGAYTLVHFLVFGQNGKYRPALANFLRDSFLGRGGKTQFLSTMGVKADALESEWRNYVKSVSGT